jgi:hypothetical protein
MKPSDSKLVGVSTLRADLTGSQSDSESFDPDPGYARCRQPDVVADDIAYLRRVAKKTLPRLAEGGRCKIINMDGAQPVKTAIPYGTKVTD